MTKIMEAIKTSKHLKATSYCTIKIIMIQKNGYIVQKKKKKKIGIAYKSRKLKKKSSVFRLLRPSILYRA